MCKDCGCSDPSRVENVMHAHDHVHDNEHGHLHSHGHDGNALVHRHDHDHDHSHDHQHRLGEVHTIAVERSLVELNDHLAMHNRERFCEAGVLAVNMMSSPGAGKTRLLERTLDDLVGRVRIAVITGDLHTENDARRLEGRGATIVPVTTGTMCHLEADMVSQSCKMIDLIETDVLFIENVGNLVCPASFDLGEELRVVLMSTTEGEDKPLKYPPMFKLADVVLLTKMDLAEPAGFDREAAVANIRSVAPQAQLIEVSARTGDGMEDWYSILRHRLPNDVRPSHTAGTAVG